MVDDEGRAGAIADADRDPRGDTLRTQWIADLGLGTDSNGSDPTLEWNEVTEEWEGGLQEAFAQVLVAAARAHHDTPSAENRPLPILIFQLDDPVSSMRWTRAANPPALLAHLRDYS